MSDPAIEAAQRAMHGWQTPLIKGTAIDAAHEALKPVRELHRKSRLYELAISGTCDELDHETFEDSAGEWCCRQCTDATDEQIYVCAACSDMDSNSEWPCPTAELIYTSEELA